MINIEELGSGRVEAGRNFWVCKKAIWNRSGVSMEGITGKCGASAFEWKMVCGDNAGWKRLGLEGDTKVDIIDVKCDPDMVGLLTQTYGFLPGYHMNKKYWITMLLDGTVSEAKILDFLDMSYDLIDGSI